MAFQKGPIEGVVIAPFRKFVDERGWLAEIFRHDELPAWFRPESTSYNRRTEVAMGGNNPGSVLIPKGVVHCYRCISTDAGVVINCPDRLFMGQGKAEPIDEIRHEDDPENPFVKDELARRAHV